MPYGVIYKWNTGDFDCCLKPYKEGYYKRSSRNECGSYIDTVHVSFSLCEDCLVLPNAFTPNGDGSNDEFRGEGRIDGSTDFQFSIWNRWGELLFESDNIDNGWDGTHQGVMSQVDTYVWVITYSHASQEKIKLIVP